MLAPLCQKKIRQNLKSGRDLERTDNPLIVRYRSSRACVVSASPSVLDPVPARAAGAACACPSKSRRPTWTKPRCPAKPPRRLRCGWPRRRRARSAAASPASLVIGCDQVAALDGRASASPATTPAAVAQLRRCAAATSYSTPRSRCSTPQAARMQLADGADDGALSRLQRPRDRALPRARAAVRLRRQRQDRGLGIALVERVESDDPSALIGLPLIAARHDARQRRRRGHPMSAVGTARTPPSAGTLYLHPRRPGQRRSRPRCCRRRRWTCVRALAPLHRGEPEIGARASSRRPAIRCRCAKRSIATLDEHTAARDAPGADRAAAGGRGLRAPVGGGLSRRRRSRAPRSCGSRTRAACASCRSSARPPCCSR